jgi:hypothetical protein
MIGRIHFSEAMEFVAACFLKVSKRVTVSAAIVLAQGRPNAFFSRT